MYNHPILFIFFLSLIFSDISLALDDGTLDGGWKAITNVTDPTVVDIGKFAVDEHNNKEQLSLEFQKVVSGETQVVAGLNYNLTITAVDAGVDNNYVAVVWDKPWEKFRQLLSFNGPI